MKAICIDAGNFELTFGKTYRVLKMTGDYIEIFNDNGFPGSYLKKFFKIVE